MIYIFTIIVYINLFLSFWPEVRCFRIQASHISKHARAPLLLFSLDNQISSDSADSPSYLPLSPYDLAHDIAYSAKVALINRLSRIQVDINTKSTFRAEMMMQFLLFLSEAMIDEDISKVYLFFTTVDEVDFCKQVLAEYRYRAKLEPTVAANTTLDRLVDKLSIADLEVINVDFGLIRKTKSLFIMSSPDNICANAANILSNIQILCLHASLRSIPVMMINPNLMATSYSSYGVKRPLLLSDFQQVYIIRDKYFQLNRKDRWCGFIYRIGSGIDVFVLNGYDNSNELPRSHFCLQSWKGKVPMDIPSIVNEITVNYPELLSNSFATRYRTTGNEISSSSSSSWKSETAKREVRPVDVFMAMDDEVATSHREYDVFNWRNIKPAPR
jgi:hypothetical protein